MNHTITYFMSGKIKELKKKKKVEGASLRTNY